MVKYEDIRLSPSDAFDIYIKRYPNSTVRELELDKKSKSYVYKVKGYDDEKKYKAYIDPMDGTITKVKEELTKGNYKEISQASTQKIKELVDKSLEDAGQASVLDEWSLELEDGMLELEVEVKLKNGDHIEYEYNLATGELLKKK